MNTILIPYRNREKHLEYFLEKTSKLFDKYLEYRIVILEQDNNKDFNRGKLLNVGFKEYKHKTDYYITHDVDVNPLDDTVKNTYTINNSIMGIYTSSCDTLGGIVKISTEHIFKINGFGNEFWGWGCEDKNLQNRAEYYKLPIIKKIKNNSPEKDKYFKIFNDINDRKRVNLSTKTNFEYSSFKRLSDKDKEDNILKSGLNNIVYNINKIENIQENVIKIKVEI